MTLKAQGSKAPIITHTTCSCPACLYFFFHFDLRLTISKIFALYHFPICVGHNHVKFLSPSFRTRGTFNTNYTITRNRLIWNSKKQIFVHCHRAHVWLFDMCRCKCSYMSQWQTGPNYHFSSFLRDITSSLGQFDIWPYYYVYVCMSCLASHHLCKTGHSKIIDFMFPPFDSASARNLKMLSGTSPWRCGPSIFSLACPFIRVLFALWDDESLTFVPAWNVSFLLEISSWLRSVSSWCGWNGGFVIGWNGYTSIWLKFGHCLWSQLFIQSFMVDARGLTLAL